MLTPRIRLVRPVNDGRGANIWIADHLGLATAVEVTFADTSSNQRSSNQLSANEQSANEQSAEESPGAGAFESQARATSGVNDPHLVRILEHGEINGIAFLVTQLLEGKSLRRRLLHGPVSMAELQTIVLQACDALGKAHSLGIVHGGLRPETLFAVDVANQPFIAIAGFGAPAPSANGAAVKNPYASPEQLLLGTGRDARSDLWALAVSAYELLTTTLPFEAPTPAGVTVAICNGQFALPSHYRADLAPGMDAWFAKALAKDPAHRHQNANELAGALVQALTIEPTVAAVASERPALDGSLEMDDDDGEEDEKTVKWDLPDEWSGRAVRARRSDERAASPPPSLTLVSNPATLPRATVQYPAGIQASLNSSAVTRGAAPSTMPPRMPSRAADTSSSNSAPNAVLNTLPNTLSNAVAKKALAKTVPPGHQPGPHLDSPYLASVASALAIPNPTARERPLAGSVPPMSGAAQPSHHTPGSFFSNKDLFTADKTWLAALAFAAGVAVTWFAYEPDSEGDVIVAEATSENGTANIRTVSVDDLPRVAGEDSDPDEELPVIIQPHQLPRATDEAGDDHTGDDRAVATPAPSVRPSSSHGAVPTGGTVQKVRALSPTAVSTPAASTGAASTAATSTPTTSTPATSTPATSTAAASTPARSIAAVAPAAASSAAASNAAGAAAPPRAKPGDARGNCSPPYYFDTQGIQRLKAECLGGSAVITGPYGAVLATNVAAKPATPAAKQQSSEKQARAGSNCSPPYYFDGKIRRLKLDCL